MKIGNITLKNFRCFGSEPTTVALHNMTGLIGSNGAGKTAVLMALSRVFGISQNERRIVSEDFHVSAGKKLDDCSEIQLIIEVTIEFPELVKPSVEDLGIPQSFNQMVISGSGQLPFCRIRLEATWTKGTLPEGDVDETTSWITTADSVVKDEHKIPMPSYARSMVHVLYVPAFRDAAKQLSQVTGSLVYRLLRAIQWSEDTKAAVSASSKAIRESVHKEESIKHIHECLSKCWTALHDSPTFKTVVFQPVAAALEQILRQIEAVFSPGEDGLEHPIERLSDGLKSLFYFALVSSVFSVEETVKTQQTAKPKEEGAKKQKSPQLPFSFQELQPPSLTVFAVEEPENHLAPHYLGRILALLEQIAKSGSGQVVLTSHSPSILGRIDPEDVVYLRVDEKTQTSAARPISLPKDKGPAYKFVKEAVRAYPELYFSTLVVLGEGDSEEVVIPRVANAFGVHLDRSFVSVVPLGGRHVNHFWRLLHDLDIPHLTLLDFDRERGGGGWGRVKYAIRQLLEIGVPKEKLLSVSEKDGKTRVLSDEEFEEMHTWDAKDSKSFKGWLQCLEEWNVFFCFPLDLDFLMLRKFPSAYEASADGKPQIPKQPSEDYDNRLKRACVATLKGESVTGETYTADERQAFIWYSYLFLGKGKPTTHLLALGSIPDKELVEKCPAVLKRIIENLKAQLPAYASPA